MSPEDLASLLTANPYPGCIVTRPGGAVRLDFDGLTLVYRADGWHFGDLLLATPSTVPDVHAEIRRILKVVFSLKVERALGEAEADGAVDPIEYLANLAAEKMLAILDVAALANVRQAKIASNVAEAAAREMRIADLERDLAAKDASLKTAHAALKRICEVIGAPVPCVAEDAVEAVRAQLGASEHTEARVRETEATMRKIGLALGDAGAPAVYDMPDDTEQDIPDPERIRILGERLRTERGEREQEALRAQRHADHLRDAHLALDDRGAPRHADGVTLTPTARIRAIPR